MNTGFHKPPMPLPDEKYYSIKSFRWCDTEYTPKELEETFHSQVPFLMMTTQGYLGRDEWMNAVASDEIYWLREIAKQPRIVVRTAQNTYFSVPLNCPQSVIPFVDGHPAGMSMSIMSLVEDTSYSQFIFEQDRVYAYEGPNRGESTKFGLIQIVDRYDERFLVVHALSSGRLYYEASVIPLYMPITMVIAVSMARGDHTDYYQTMLNMKSYIDSIPKDMSYPKQLKETSDIMMYDGKPAEGEYDYLEPLKYVTLQKDWIGTNKEALYTSLFQDSGSNTTVASLGQEAAARSRTLSKSGSQRSTSSSNSDGDKNTMKRKSFKPKCGVRGKDTNIAIRARLGYHVCNIDPSEVLVELQEVFRSRSIPAISLLLQAVQWTDSEGEPDTLDSAMKPSRPKSKKKKEPPPIKPKTKGSIRGLPAPSPGYVPLTTAASSLNRSPPAPPPPPTPISPTTSDGEPSPVRNRTVRDTISNLLQSQLSATSIPGSRKNEYSLAPTADKQKHVPQSAYTGAYEAIPGINPGSETKHTKLNTKPVNNRNSVALPLPTGGRVYDAIPQDYERPNKHSQSGSGEGRPYKSKDDVPPTPVRSPLSPTHSATGSKSAQVFGQVRPSVQLPPEPPPFREFLSIDDVPYDISSLDDSDVCRCLSFLKLDSFKDQFQDNQIDGSLLLSLDVEALMQLGLTKLQAIKLLKFAKDGWRPAGTLPRPANESDL